jgi:hypothetical protein
MLVCCVSLSIVVYSNILVHYILGYTTIDRNTKHTNILGYTTIDRDTQQTNILGYTTIERDGLHINIL